MEIKRISKAIILLLGVIAFLVSCKKDITFVVYHYLEKVDGSGYDLPKEKANRVETAGKIGEAPHFKIAKFPGFTWDKKLTKAPKKLVAEANANAVHLYYKRNTVTCTLDPNGGVFPLPDGEPSSEALTFKGRYGSAFTETQPTRSGWAFAGWATEKKGPVSLDSIPVYPAVNTSYFAQWTEADTTYTVHHRYQDTDGEKYTAEPVVVADCAGKTGAVPIVSKLVTAKEGFTFDEEATGSLAPTAGDGSSVYTLYYSRNRYTLKFDKGSAEGVTGDAPEDATKLFGVALSLPGAGTLAREGFDFLGWQTNEEPHTVYSGQLTDDETENGSVLTLVPNWTRDSFSYQVEIFEQALNGSDYPSEATETQTLAIKKNTVPPDSICAERPGFTFDRSDPSPLAAITANGQSVRLYYRRNSYTVTYHENNASASEQTQQGRRYYGDSQFHLASVADLSFAKEFCSFDGWYTDAACSAAAPAYGDGAAYTADQAVDLYAKWVRRTNTFTVCHLYQTTDGTSYPVEPEAEGRITYTVSQGETPELESLKVAKTGFSFAASDPVDLPQILDDTTVITLKYSRNRYPVVYDKNGEGVTGAVPPQADKLYQVPLTVAAPGNLAKTNFCFKGWNTDPNGGAGGVAYAVGASVTDDAKNLAGQTEATRLYAVWQPADATYTVCYRFEEADTANFVANGDKPDATQNGVAGTRVTLSTDLPSALADLYTYRSDYAANQTAAGTLINENNTTVVTLYFHRKTVLLTFDLNGGTATPALLTTQTVKIGSSLTPPNSVVKEGFAFTQWNPPFPATAPKTAATYTAEWETAPYLHADTRTVFTNGFDLTVSGEGGTRVLWSAKNRDLHSINPDYPADLSDYSISGAGALTLTGGTLRNITGMTALSLSGNPKIGHEATDEGVDLTGSVTQVTVNGNLTGDPDSILVVASESNDPNRVYATKTGGTFTPDEANIIKLRDKTKRYTATLMVQPSDAAHLVVYGTFYLPPGEDIDISNPDFTLTGAAVTISGTIFSVGVENGWLKVPSTVLSNADFEMGIPYPEGGYTPDLTTDRKYTYIQFKAQNGKIASTDAESFLQRIMFTLESGKEEIKIKANFETVALEAMTDGITYFNGSFYNSYSGSSYFDWPSAYNSAKQKLFNGLKGYLFTATSHSENKFIYDKVMAAKGIPVEQATAWIGATRAVNGNGGYDALQWEGGLTGENIAQHIGDQWVWACGPEAGTVFYKGPVYTGSSQSPTTDLTVGYSCWNNFEDMAKYGIPTGGGAGHIEPNNWKDNSGTVTNECFAQYTGQYIWNDLPITSEEQYYIVEWSNYVGQNPTAKPIKKEIIYYKNK